MFDVIIPNLNSEEEDVLKKHIKAERAYVGSLLLELGCDSRDLIFVFEGRLEIYKRLNIASQVIAVKVATLNAPVLIGEGSLFSKSSRTATVLVTEEVKYFKLPYSAFEKIKEEKPSLAIKILEHSGNVIAERFVGLQQKVNERLMGDAPTAEEGLARLNKYIGSTRICKPELAKKLFRTPPVPENKEFHNKLRKEKVFLQEDKDKPETGIA